MNLSDSEDPEEHELLYSEFGRDNIQSNNFGTKTKTEIDLYNPITLIPGSNDKIEDNQNDCNDIVSIDSSPNPSPRNSIDDLTDHEENDDVDEDDSDCKNSIILPDLLPGKIYTSDEVYFNDADGSVEPPDLPEEEYEEVMNESNGSLLPNKNYYLLSFNWYKKWKNFTKCNGIDYDRPEPIDNSSLLTSFSPKANMYILNRDDDITKYEEEELYKLKSHISERSDYIILTEESWHLLYGWYGGGPSISRLSYQEKGYRDSRLDFYGYSMTILRSDNEDELVISVRKAVTVEEFLIGLINEWNIEIDELNNQSGDLADLIKLSDVRLWDYFNKSRYALLSNSSTLDDANITEDQEMMVEFIQDDGTWQWEESRISSSNNYSSNNYSSYDPYSSYSTSYTNYNDENVVTLKRQPPMKGLVGLTNLGNTCFMNSIIQCLSASTPLREVFSSKAYIADLNVDNPLGHKGKVAEGFASLMDVMYQDVEDGGGSVVAPRAFKRVIGDIAPQFQGYDQHDSQELLNFLLDGLHEDLNRVLVKESTNSVEGGDRTDEEVAAESLLVYKKRNDSIIADLCSGQFKSTVVCPDCHLKSRTFDAYFSISLPLAKESATEMMMSIKLITLSGKKMMYSISLPRVGPVAVIKVKVAEAYAESLLKSSSKSKSKLKTIPPNHLALVEIHSKSFYKMFEDLESIDTIQKHDEIVCYEIAHHDAFWATTVWEPLVAISEWFKQPIKNDTWVADFDDENNNAHDKDNLVEEEKEGQDGLQSNKTLPMLDKTSSSLSLWDDGDIWVGSFKPCKIKKRSSPCKSSFESILDDEYSYFNNDDLDDVDENDDQNNNYGFLPSNDDPMSCRIQMITPRNNQFSLMLKSLECHDNDDYNLIINELNMNDNNNDDETAICVFTYEGMNRKQYSLLLVVSYNHQSEQAIMKTIGKGQWIYSSSSTHQNNISQFPPYLKFTFHVSLLNKNNKGCSLLWTPHPIQGSGDSSAVIEKMNPSSPSASSSSSSSSPSSDAGYVMVDALKIKDHQSKEEKNNDLADRDDNEKVIKKSRSIEFDSTSDHENNQDGEEDDEEEDDKKEEEKEDIVVPIRKSVVVQIVHKTYDYGGLYTSKIGIPFLLTLPWTCTEKQAKDMILKEVSKQGCNIDLPFTLKRATKHFEDEARYNSGMSQRVGQEVGQEKIKNNKFWKPKKSKPITVSSPSWTSVNSSHYSSSHYSSSNYSNNSFNNENHIYLVMTWARGLKEKDIFNNKNDDDDDDDNDDGDGDNKSNLMTLEDCLELFAVTEKLSEQDSWYCPQCKEFKEATKKMDIWTTPPLLCLHLKRFSIDASSFWADKLETPIHFPIHEKLDMSKHCLKEILKNNKKKEKRANDDDEEEAGKDDDIDLSKYSLYAVSNHYGGTGGGHYTGYVRNVENGKWYDCDDSSVTEMTSSSDDKIELDGSSAYVLFYLRDDYAPSSWNTP